MTPCRLCGKNVPKRKPRTGIDHRRQHLKHNCPHGRECESGKRGLIARTLAKRCSQCRAASLPDGD